MCQAHSIVRMLSLSSAFALGQKIFNRFDQRINIRLGDISFCASTKRFLPVCFVSVTAVKDTRYGRRYRLQVLAKFQSRSIRQSLIKYI